MKKVLITVALVAACVAPIWAAQRGVVAELITATWCPYWTPAEAAIRKIADDEGLDKFVPVAWHASASDPYYTAEAGARMAYYGATGYPTCYFDGTDFIRGGPSNVYDLYLAMYNSHKLVPSILSIEFLTNSYEDTRASVSVKVKLEESVPEGHVVHIILWEDKIASQYNFCERRMAQYEVLTAKNANDEQVIKRTFTLDASWNKANLGVSAWVQNFAGKQILNGRATKLVEGVAVTPTSIGRVKALYR